MSIPPPRCRHSMLTDQLRLLISRHGLDATVSHTVFVAKTDLGVAQFRFRKELFAVIQSMQRRQYPCDKCRHMFSRLRLPA